MRAVARRRRPRRSRGLRARAARAAPAAPGSTSSAAAQLAAERPPAAGSAAAASAGTPRALLERVACCPCWNAVFCERPVEDVEERGRSARSRRRTRPRNATRQMMSRVRSSSRCSTRLSRPRARSAGARWPWRDAAGDASARALGHDLAVDAARGPRPRAAERGGRPAAVGVVGVVVVVVVVLAPCR